MDGMELRLFGRAQKKIVAIADIGSGSAGFAIVEVRTGKPALLLGAERSVLPLEERGKEAALARIGELLSNAASRALEVYTGAQKGKGAPESLYIIVRAPWIRSKAVRAAKDLPQEVKITPQAISRLAREALSSGAGIDTKHFFEATVTSIELNGYPTKRPEGKVAHRVAITGLVSECEPATRSAIEASLRAHLPHLKPQYRSATRALLSTIGEHLPTRDFIMIDVASEATTLTVVYDGVAEAQELVGEGLHGMLSRLSPSGMPDETLGLLRMLEQEHCDSEACDTLRASIGKVEPELARSFGEGMGKLAALRKLPNYAVLSAHGSATPWLARFFSRIDFTQFTLTAQPFSVRELSAQDFSQWVEAGPGTELDVGLAVAGTLVNKEEMGE